MMQEIEESDYLLVQSDSKVADVHHGDSSPSENTHGTKFQRYMYTKAHEMEGGLQP